MFRRSAFEALKDSEVQFWYSLIPLQQIARDQQILFVERGIL